MAGIAMVPINLIQRNELNSYPITDIEDIKNSIIDCGLLTPLSVIGPYEDGTYKLISGERRLTALNLIHDEGGGFYEQIPVHVIGDKDTSTNLQELWIETSNLETRDLGNPVSHYFKVIEVLKKMAANKEENVTERNIATKMAEHLKISDRYARYCGQIFNNGVDELIGAVKEREIPIKVGAKISSLSPEDQVKAVEEIRNYDARGGKTEFEKTVIDKYKNGDQEASGETAEKNHTADAAEERDTTRYEITDDMLDDLGDLPFDRDSALFGGPSLSIDTSGVYHSMENDDREKDSTRQSRIQTVVNWCEMIRVKDADDLSDDDWMAINACREVAEHFA